MTAWKDLERRVARCMSGKRSGPTGIGGEDVTGTPFSIECKRTTRYALRRSWIEQAQRQSKQNGKPWLLVISEHRDRDPIACMRLSTLIALTEGHDE